MARGLRFPVDLRLWVIFVQLLFGAVASVRFPTARIRKPFIRRPHLNAGIEIKSRKKLQEYIGFRGGSSLATVKHSVDENMPFVNQVGEDATVDSIKSQIASSPVCLVLAVASFVPQCKSLLCGVAKLEDDYAGGCCGGPSADKPLVLVISTCECDELEELAIELGLNDVPSYQIYKDGKLADSNEGKSVVKIADIRDALKKVSVPSTGGGCGPPKVAAPSDGGGCCPPKANAPSSGGGCCPPKATAPSGDGGGCCPPKATAPSSGGGCCPPKESAPSDGGGCCPPGRSVVCCPDDSSAPTEAGDVLRMVQQSYAATVQKNSDGEDGGCCVSVDPSLIGYTPEQIIKAGKDANLGLGCGNPMSFANIEEGETVLDLGSGAGIDCFLAGDAVGTSGEVIGVDMTPEMIHKARKNAADRKASNVQFRLGEIEHLPVADSTVDVVMSNCVINLSPDKPQVFREIYRILKTGGRVAITDVVIRPEQVIPEHLKTAEALAC